MEIEFDPAKDLANREKRGVSLQFAARVLADPNRLVDLDTRRDYGEERSICFGAVDRRLYVAVFPQRHGRCRILSVRKANDREAGHYLAHSRGE